MTEEQAARTGFHEFTLRWKGKEQEQRERWTIARWMCWQDVLLSPNIKPGSKPRTPQAFCRFPWEKSEKEEIEEKARAFRLTPEQEAELNKIMAEFDAKRNLNNEQDR